MPALAIGLILSSTAFPAAAAASQCVRGWMGSIQYSRSQANNSSRSEQRVSGKGMDSTTSSMTYDYSAQVAVRAGTAPGVSFGRADIGLTSVSSESRASTDEDICPGTYTPRQMSSTFVTKS